MQDLKSDNQPEATAGQRRIAIIGGGAAGFFAAVCCAEANPACQVVIYERGKSVLEKVRVSGGGRCNVTNACTDPALLIKNYPRGSRELLGPFTQFGPQQTIEWFARHKVQLKTEPDGRMFPNTDDSQTICDCLTQSAINSGITILKSTRVDRFHPREDGSWALYTDQHNNPEVYDSIMVATGSSSSVWDTLAQLGHTIIPSAPSLFTFNTKDTRLRDLSGLSVSNAHLSIPDLKLQAEGPLLVTHWGMSGPAILRLSAWGARVLQEQQYTFKLHVNWTPIHKQAELADALAYCKGEHSKKLLRANPMFQIPQRLWVSLITAAGISETLRWADVNKEQMKLIAAQLGDAVFQINGKSTFKEEFVTAGGVDLKEINFKTFESKRLPGLYLAGEVLNIDAITGGFNFQAAWTGAWLAAQAMASPF